MDGIEWVRRKEELAGLARFAVSKAWRANTAWRQIDPLIRSHIPNEFMQSMSGFMAVASYLWEDYGDLPLASLSNDERRQAKAHLN